MVALLAVIMVLAGGCGGEGASGGDAGKITDGQTNKAENQTVSGQAVSSQAVSGQAVGKQEEDQLKRAAAKRNDWTEWTSMYGDGEVNLDYLNYGEGLAYAVTDLDMDGNLEILTSNTDGSGGYVTNHIMEYSPEDNAFAERKVKESGISITQYKKVDVYYDAGSNCYHYACDGCINTNGYYFSHFYGSLYLENDILKEDRSAAYFREYKSTGKKAYYVNKKKTTKEEYSRELENTWDGMAKGTAAIGWKFGKQDMMNVTEDELYSLLLESWEGFSVNIPE